MKLTDLAANEDPTTLNGQVLQECYEEHGRIHSPVSVMIGGVGGEAVRWMKKIGLGRMWSSNRPLPYPGERWALDNGAWSGAVDPTHLLRQLVHAVHAEPLPQFVVLPDRYQEGMKSLRLSLKWHQHLTNPDAVADDLDRDPYLQEKFLEDGDVNEIAREIANLPYALALQPGMIYQEVASELHRVEVAFLGGGNAFKSSARRWTNLAHDQGLDVHYGQCGTPDKLAHAFEVGVDSVDSTTPPHNPTRSWPRYLNTLARLSRNAP